MGALSPNILWLVGAMLAALVMGSLVRIGWARTSDDVGTSRTRLASLRTWWILSLLLIGSVLLGQTAVIILLSLTSALALREFFQITQHQTGSHAGRWLAFAVVPVNYLWVWLGWYQALWISVPLALFLLVSAYTVTSGKTRGFLVDVAAEFWAVMLLVFCISHAGLLYALPAEKNSVAGGAGWFLFLVLLTESNDIAQALWGRQFGKHRVTPQVSPHKTWEGLLLGGATTVALATGLGTLLTPLNDQPLYVGPQRTITIPLFWSALGGLIIAVGGFFGDITMSAVKRDAQVKDSGTMLPGMGGILDRIDSLTYTAPLFFYYIYFLCGH